MFTTPPRRFSHAVSVVIVSLAALAADALLLTPPAVSQTADADPGFQNLQVLPSDISRKELMDFMRFDFVGGLGVRCSHCHLGEEGRPLSEYDFAADVKPTKRKARDMMRMVKEINDGHLAGLEERANPPIRVNCVTCHRGQPEPRMIQDVLHQTSVENGLDAAIARFRELREEYFGRHTYDFGPTALIAVARTLIEEDREPEAIRFLELNVEVHPEYWYSHILLSQLLAEDDPDQARRELERALGLAPDESVRWVRTNLDALWKEAAEEASGAN